MFFAFLHWDPDPQLFELPFVHWPILWYGVFFALGFAVGFSIFYSLLVRFLKKDSEATIAPIKKNAMFLADRLTLYVVVATVIGARLGHFLFYENPSDYLLNPLEIFWIWKGGLASHGAAIGIVIGAIVFARRYRYMNCPHWICLLDLICVPTAFAGACIRLGNFFNQEILGTCTSVPWAVIFGHPMDRSAPAPRHPVQLYEAFFYLAVFFLLWRLSYRPSYLYVKGRLIGLFLALVFGGRLIFECFKVEQSALIGTFFVTMGQLLSIVPLIASFFLLRSAKGFALKNPPKG